MCLHIYVTFYTNTIMPVREAADKYSASARYRKIKLIKDFSFLFSSSCYGFHFSYLNLGSILKFIQSKVSFFSFSQIVTALFWSQSVKSPHFAHSFQMLPVLHSKFLWGLAVSFLLYSSFSHSTYDFLCHEHIFKITFLSDRRWSLQFALLFWKKFLAIFDCLFFPNKLYLW